MPSPVVDDPYGKPVVLICPHKAIKDKELLIFYLFPHHTKYLFEVRLRNWVVNFPPVDGIVCFFIIDYIPVIWRPASEFASFDRKSASCRKDAFFSFDYDLDQ